MAVTAIAQTQPAPKLRVLIVALFQKQLAMLQREFPDLDIHAVINRRKGTNVDVKGTAVNADRIVVMTRFASHTAEWQLDKSKVTRVNGAWSNLRKLLTSWSVYSRAQAPTVLKAVRIETPPDSVVDYSAFRTCKPGDVLEFVRPELVPAHVFAQNVFEARRFYEANAGVTSTSEIKGGKARVFILDRVRPVLEAAEAELTGKRDDFALAFEDQRALQELFRDVYSLSFNAAPFAPDSHHATVANVAVDGWLEMFKTTEH